jgi:hypothetical protein
LAPEIAAKQMKIKGHGEGNAATKKHKWRCDHPAFNASPNADPFWIFGLHVVGKTAKQKEKNHNACDSLDVVRVLPQSLLAQSILQVML